ncbi:MAG: PAS domain-containing sensor histidine kinase [Phenylobacterium sp.]|uniref:PAS domain-containing hybrid sensor histidine kinase/response regulator n=1 Tax=Phenylobacterium sp. TaxID=1871053 RepID=UPI001222E016|nr:PAS domain-containing hybrid sensor histidine kinase/response regulator [Phenylobacterium sp.]TAJ73851.1 MAG: PAS domain-containing sensor histidine kinase [Phenylobacterium sp.]
MITSPILDEIGDAIYALDTDWRFTLFNNQAEQFFGRDRKEVLGRSVWDCFPAARGTELAHLLEEVMRSRKPAHLEVLSPSTGRWTDTRIFPLTEGGIVANWRDITREKQQQAQLAEAIEAREDAMRELRTVISHVPAMIAHWDSDLKCTFANDSYLEWFGRTAEDMIGLSIQDLMGEALFLKNEPYIRGALQGRRQAFERTLTKPSGEVAHSWAQYIPDLDDHARVRGFYAMVTDVTPLKQVEESLRTINAELQLARDEAQVATAVKSAFLSNMSHELRNPLTAIIGYAELLAKKGSLDETQRKYLIRLQDASAALLMTVNDVLDFSKLEAGEVVIERRVVDPLAIGRAALEMFEPQMDRKGLARSLEAADVPALVVADDTRLRQILANLIGNAVKFTAEGSVSVRCLYDRTAHLLRYEVIDTGPGIPADSQAQLFQRFSQMDASTSRIYGGTGLGLAICRGLAQAMGGEVGVLSIAGEGSCFWVQVPCEPTTLEVLQREDLEHSLPHPDALRGLRVLVVDDEAANRELVRHMVEPLGVLVTEAEGGAEAVAAARSGVFDVILMDVRMPNIDGPTAAQLIRSRAGRKVTPPIVAFTADIGGGMPPTWRGHFDAILGKPIVGRDLVSLLAEHRPKPLAPQT